MLELIGENHECDHSQNYECDEGSVGVHVGSLIAAKHNDSTTLRRPKSCAALAVKRERVAEPDDLIFCLGSKARLTNERTPSQRLRARQGIDAAPGMVVSFVRPSRLRFQLRVERGEWAQRMGSGPRVFADMAWAA